MQNAQQINLEHLDALVENNLPFIVRTISSVTGRYVSVEHDDTFSVALEAFAEAVERFQEERGNFLSFAGLVIRSRLNTYLEKENRSAHVLSLEALEEDGAQIPSPEPEGSSLRDEIQMYQQELLKFGLTLDQMVDASPKHQDTRKNAMHIAKQASEDEKIVSDTYRKRKLPIRPVAALCRVSEKVVKTSKTFILGSMLVFVKKLSGLESWIIGTR